MPLDPSHFETGGALQGAVAASLLRQRDAAAELPAGVKDRDSHRGIALAKLRALLRD